MWLFIKLALRNLLRNKRRTILSGIAIGVGLAGLMFTDALTLGILDHMIESATKTFTGQAQIHHKDFKAEMAVGKVIDKPEQLIQRLKEDKNIESFSLRTQSLGMITSPADVRNVMAIGVDFQKEQYVSKLKKAVIKGEYPENGLKKKVLIGKDLARYLEADINDKIVLTFAQANTGEISQELYRIGGIFEFQIQEMDQSMVFLDVKDAQKMLQIGNNYHEISVNLIKPEMAYQKVIFNDKYSSSENTADTWVQFLSQISTMQNMTGFMLFIVSLILFGIVAIGIVNTLFMSLYERMFEFGVLKAIGTRPFNIGFMIICEAGWLAVVSVVIGFILGGGITFYLAENGIDYSGTEFMGATLTELTYPVLHIRQFVLYPLGLVFFTMLVGLYPARYAARLTPSKAMRKSL